MILGDVDLKEMVNRGTGKVNNVALKCTLLEVIFKDRTWFDKM